MNAVSKNSSKGLNNFWTLFYIKIEIGIEPAGILLGFDFDSDTEDSPRQSLA
jgi:hypothetical protein